MKKLILFFAAALMASCSSDDNNNSNTQIPAATATTYVKGNMGSAPFDYSYYLNAPLSPYQYGYGNGFSGDGFTRYYYYGGSFHEAGNFDKSFSIYFQNMYYGDTDESAESAAFYNSFSTIPTNYLTSLQDDAHLKGIEVDYDMGTDVFYSTKYGSQSGSSFTVTSATNGIEAGGSLKVITMIGTLNCKLYNFMDPSDVITISNAQYKIVIREYN